MNSPRLLDLFCGAGGSSVGFYRAGFEVVGVDNKPQPHYPLEFHLADAFEYLAAHWREFDVFGASPPCQRYSVETPMAYRANHPDLIGPTRTALQATGKPFVIENVENARALLINPVKLCGSMFGMNLWRHRYFEMWPRPFILTPPCNHAYPPVLISGTTRRKPEKGGRFEFTAQQRRDAADLQWMTRTDMDQAIPPVYTEFIGRQLLTMIV